ncbi:MAG: ATP-binding protein [Candidatus Lokiarchaeota archaeon]|nr:ATP-binding protein [Candidatus Lokiarchaeota archaeon]
MRDAPNLGFRSTWLEQYEQSLETENITAKRKKGIKYYLDMEEGDQLEFKGSLVLDIDRFLRGDGKLDEKPEIACKGVLKTIVAFLNSKGGDLIIGILEKDKYEEMLSSKLSEYSIYKKYVIFGLSNEYRKDGWDGYFQRILTHIENRIGAEIYDSELVRIEKIVYENEELCHVSVKLADSRQYLDEKFYIRRGNTSIELKGKEIDNYWAKRNK